MCFTYLWYWVNGVAHILSRWCYHSDGGLRNLTGCHKAEPTKQLVCVCTGGDARRVYEGNDTQIWAAAVDTSHWCAMIYNNISITIIIPIKSTPSFDLWHHVLVWFFVCVSVTCGCPGSELGVKMKCVFRSSHCRFEWRPYFLPVQLLLR